MASRFEQRNKKNKRSLELGAGFRRIEAENMPSAERKMLRQMLPTLSTPSPMNGMNFEERKRERERERERERDCLTLVVMRVMMRCVGLNTHTSLVS